MAKRVEHAISKKQCKARKNSPTTPSILAVYLNSDLPPESIRRYLQPVEPRSFKEMWLTSEDQALKLSPAKDKAR
jgi:hypothetical protein